MLVCPANRVRAGSARVPGTLYGAGASAGPVPRTSTGRVPVVPWPPTTKPAVRIFAPVPTVARHEISARRPGLDPFPDWAALGVSWSEFEGSEVPLALRAVTR